MSRKFHFKHFLGKVLKRVCTSLFEFISERWIPQLKPSSLILSFAELRVFYEKVEYKTFTAAPSLTPQFAKNTSILLNWAGTKLCLSKTWIILRLFLKVHHSRWYIHFCLRIAPNVKLYRGCVALAGNWTPLNIPRCRYHNHVKEKLRM